MDQKNLGLTSNVQSLKMTILSKKVLSGLTSAIYSMFLIFPEYKVLSSPEGGQTSLLLNSNVAHINYWKLYVVCCMSNYIIVRNS